MARVFASVLRLFWRDRWTRFTLICSALLNAVALALIWRYMPRTETVLLHYNTRFGIDFIGSWWQVLALPLSSLYLLLLNALVGAVVWRRDRILSYFLDIGTLAVAVTCLVAAALIIYLNI